METLEEFRDIEPEPALVKWSTKVWTDRQFKHWLIIRSEINGKQADKIIAHLKEVRQA